MYRAIGLVLDFIHRLVCGRQKISQRFGDWICLRPQVDGAGQTYSVGPVRQHKPSSESFQVYLRCISLKKLGDKTKIPGKDIRPCSRDSNRQWMWLVFVRHMLLNCSPFCFLCWVRDPRAVMFLHSRGTCFVLAAWLAGYSTLQALCFPKHWWVSNGLNCITSHKITFFMVRLTVILCSRPIIS
jgi:hypothetical protein